MATQLKYSAFIPFNTPSLKNSRQGKFYSKAVRKYLQKIGVKRFSSRDHTVECYKKRPNLFGLAVNSMRDVFRGREAPHIIELYFVRDSKRKFDWINAAQIIADLLTAHRVIDDDNMDCLIPMPVKIAGSWYAINKETPGCHIYY